MKPQDIHKSNTFSNFSNHKLSNWFSSFGFIHTKRKSNYLKTSKSLSKFKKYTFNFVNIISFSLNFINFNFNYDLIGKKKLYFGQHYEITVIKIIKEKQKKKKENYEGL